MKLSEQIKPISYLKAHTAEVVRNLSTQMEPFGLRTPCLTFGVTAACPMLAIRWLTYLA